MQAIVFQEFGGPGVLRLTDVDDPRPGEGQVRVAVRAAGVNPIDYKIRNGWMEGMFRTPLPAIPGIEIAGVVDELGPGVTGFAVGDEVLGWSTGGAYAQYTLGRTLARKPAELSWETAAALPIAAETAQRGLDLLGVSGGETVLINGAAGAVGTVAVQLAALRGATVIGTASPANHDYLRSLGATPVGYGDGLADRVRAVAPQGVDAVFDVAGRGALPDAIALLDGSTDRIVTIADPDADQYGVTFTSQSHDSTDQLAEHARLAADGKLKLTVARTFPLAEAAEAHRVSEAGHARGKLVLLT